MAILCEYDNVYVPNQAPQPCSKPATVRLHIRHRSGKTYLLTRCDEHADRVRQQVAEPGWYDPPRIIETVHLT